MEVVTKLIKDYPNYSINTNGEVFNIKTNRMVKASMSGSGYMTIKLCNTLGSKTYNLHKLVAQTFLDNINNEKTINHKNGIKIDNTLNNLEWCSYSHNTKEAYKLGLNNGRPKMKVFQYDLQNNLLNIFESLHDADRKTNIDYRNIYDCIIGKKKSAGGFIWKKMINNG
jgi:hypothetical protein